MHYQCVFLGCGCLLLLTGCRPTVSPGGRPTIAVAPAETYTHAPSRFSFPPNVGSFAREAVTQYDREGLDVSVGYNLGQDVAMTVYVYPIGEGKPDSSLEGQVEKCKRQILTQHAGAKVISEAPVTVSPGGQKRSGRQSVFTYTGRFAHRQQAVRSELCLFAVGPWFIKYRVTYPVARQTEAEPAIRTFLEELHWPEKDS
jgi:hypothetical protein